MSMIFVRSIQYNPQHLVLICCIPVRLFPYCTIMHDSGGLIPANVPQGTNRINRED